MIVWPVWLVLPQAAVATVPLLLLAQTQQYRERQILDPQTGEWVDRLPTEQQPVGPLEQARTLLAQGRSRQARKLLETWIRSNRQHERYLEAELLLAECWFAAGDFHRAYEHAEIVADRASGELYYQAIRREMDIARAYLSGRKRIVWGVLRLPAYDEAIEILDRVWERVPGTRLAEQALKLKADHYYEQGKVDLAQDEYANLASQFPAGRYHPFAMLRAAQAAELAFPGVRFDDSALTQAEERYRQYQVAYPEPARREGIELRLAGIRRQRAEKDLAVARWYERTRRLGAAEFYYRQILERYPDTPAATAAQTRLRAMGLDVPLEQAPEGAGQ